MISARFTYDGGHYSNRYGVDDVTGLGLAGAACPLLTRLALCNCIGLTDPGLASFAGAFPLTALVINETNLFDKYASRSRFTYDLGELDL